MTGWPPREERRPGEEVKREQREAVERALSRDALVEKARRDPAVIEAVSRPRVWRNPEAMIRAVLDAVWDDLEEALWREGSMHRMFEAARAEAYGEARDGFVEWLRSERDRIRAAYNEHNQGRDLSRQPPRRPDLGSWADAYEAAANQIVRGEAPWGR